MIAMLKSIFVLSGSGTMIFPVVCGQHAWLWATSNITVRWGCDWTVEADREGISGRVFISNAYPLLQRDAAFNINSSFMLCKS